ncbi:MAG: class I SAM-dependent methyltransferase [Saprospiraceae bacterium]
MNNNIFRKNIVQIDDNIWEVEGLQKGEYDTQAVQYDNIISNGIYNRIMWGNSPKDYSNFCQKGLVQSANGIIADIGCGTLSFTYREYSEFSGDDLYLCDLSFEMLKIGKTRIHNSKSDTSNINFIRLNALDMPFQDNSIDTVLCFGIFHIFDEPDILISEIFRILKPGGKLFLTSLCTDRNLSAKYLNLLYKKGHVAKPLKSIEIKSAIENNKIEILEFKAKGGMTYISGIKNNLANI